jgi:hypothetical protein
MRLSLMVLRQNALACGAALLAGLYGWAMLMATLTGHDGAIGLVTPLVLLGLGLWFTHSGAEASRSMVLAQPQRL